MVDTAPRWREIHDLRPWRRWLGGGLHGLALLGQVACHLLRGSRVLHLTTSGQLAILRDIAMLRLARAFGVRSLYHLRFGRIPELAAQGTPEVASARQALRLATTVLAIDRSTEAALRHHLPDLDLRLLPNCADLAALPTPAPSAERPHRPVPRLGDPQQEVSRTCSRPGATWGILLAAGARRPRGTRLPPGSGRPVSPGPVTFTGALATAKSHGPDGHCRPLRAAQPREGFLMLSLKPWPWAGPS
ncbi:MAG: hypothetical protein IPN91_10785 [Holophagaceae bacterium]|uniref:Uncharacterized protein n=1 Tax=Candidatus Geothrix odensensis TaxID=2954440 RepID=A0A936F3A4_9BACT|nr:hypothetical protein [Candidatus Geothrix odensensis]